MFVRVTVALGFSVAVVAGLLALAERQSVAQAPAATDQPAAVAPIPASPAAPVAPTPPPADANPQIITVPPPTASPAAAPPAAAPAPVTPPAAAAPPATPPAAAAAPAPTEPKVATPAPLPPARPSLDEKKAAAKMLFSHVQLPSLGHARAIGYYPRGCLQGGVELPVNGPNWQVMRLSRNRNWGHPELVRFLERFAPLAAKATGWHGILIGDMAQPRGGPLPFGHMSHQIGLDVDIWFMPMPNHELSKREREDISASNLVSEDWKHINPQTWSKSDIAFIRTAAEQPEVERVLVNAAIKKELCRVEGKNDHAWMAKVRPWYGHNDHIHVRLKCPADSPNCRHQPPVPGDDGCSAHALDYWFSDKVLHPKPRTGPPPRALTMADLPPACKAVLDAPANSKAVLR